MVFSMKKWMWFFFLILPSLYLSGTLKYPSLEDEAKETPLEVVGKIPAWVEGVYIRNGPSKFTVGDQAVAHWFDGLAMLHRFHLSEGSCTYSNRFLETNDYQYMMQGHLPSGGFSKSSASPSIEALEGEFYPKRPNAVVHVDQINQTPVALTEVPTPVTFDLNSLETIGVLDYADSLPKMHSYSTAHLLEKEGKTYGYLVEIGPESRYLFYVMEGAKRQELCSIPLSDPSYVHSFSLTDHYLIFVDYPLRLDFSALMKGTGFIQSFQWNEKGESRFYIINRITGELLQTLEGPPFFSFHHINAYEERGKIFIDLIGYADANVIFGQEDHDAGWRRFVIDDEKVVCEHSYLFDGELPRMNDHYNGAPYHYFYSTAFRKNVAPTDAPPLYKVDTQSHEIQTWSLRGHFASEPIFLPAPDGTTEDDGVVLSIVTNHDHTESFLLILDGMTFKEKARATLPHGVPQGLHGRFFKESPQTP